MIKSFFYPYLCPRGHTITPKLNFCPICCQKCSIRFNLIISNVWCQIVLVPNCPVPNCPGAKLSGCQIVHFYYLGAKLSVFIILVLNCPVPNWLIIVTRTILRCFEDSVSYSMTGYLLKCPGQRKSPQSLRRVGGQFEKRWIELIFSLSNPES